MIIKLARRELHLAQVDYAIATVDEQVYLDALEVVSVLVDKWHSILPQRYEKYRIAVPKVVIFLSFGTSMNMKHCDKQQLQTKKTAKN